MGWNSSEEESSRRGSSSTVNECQSLLEVRGALIQRDLNSAKLIFGIDFTKSNERTGANSFNGRSLHHIGDTPNPYEQAITIIGKALPMCAGDNKIPCYGFGDESTKDDDIFSFCRKGKFCNGLEGVLSRYREIVPHVKLAGPTSFAPVIEMAMTIVEQSGGQYHVLVIIADCQVTRSTDTEGGKLGPQEQKTVDAIAKAREFPLSIILVGVGDGPWDRMKDFDYSIRSLRLDNFQFVNFTEIMSKNVAPVRKEIEFALSALMGIPSRYKAKKELKKSGDKKGDSLYRFALPPPEDSAPISSAPLVPSSTLLAPSSTDNNQAPSSTDDNQVCPVCLILKRDMAFGCGHQTCGLCAARLEKCPMCRAPIAIRINLY